jgi:hypothetical protein
MAERIVCEACGTLNDSATAMLGDLEDDLELAQEDLAIKRKQLKALKTERSHTLEADLLYGTATAVLERWRAMCAPKAREPTSERRVRVVLDRLHGNYTQDELNRCIDGYARFPYYVKGRRCAFGDEADRFVEAETIFGKPQLVDRGITMAEAPDGAGTRPSAAFCARVPWDQVWKENRRLIVAALRRRFGGGIEGIGPGELKWPCPFCQHENPEPFGQESLSLAVFNEPGQRIVDCYRCGFNDDRFLAAVVDVEGLLG